MARVGRTNILLVRTLDDRSFTAQPGSPIVRGNDVSKIQAEANTGEMHWLASQPVAQLPSPQEPQLLAEKPARAM